VVDLRKVDCWVDGIKCKKNGHGFAPVSPHDFTRYSHTITGERSGGDSNEEDVSGLVPILVDETGG